MMEGNGCEGEMAREGDGLKVRSAREGEKG